MHENLYINKYFLYIFHLKKYIYFIIVLNILFFPKKFYFNKKNIIETDNQIFIKLYEKNLNFSNYSTIIKPIALYFPNVNFFNDIIYTNINDSKTFTNFSLVNIIKNQTELAKSHGIYGFAIHFNYYDYLQVKIVNIFFYQNINFPFLLIWDNDYFNTFLNDSQNIKLKSNIFIDLEINNFLQNTKKYLISKLYIKINGKSILSIKNPFIFPNLKDILLLLRDKAKKFEIGEIFILLPFTNIYNESQFINLIDGLYDSLKLNFEDINSYNQNNLYYTGIIYKNILLNEKYTNFTLYRNSFLEISNNSNKNSLKNYCPEKYFLLNKIIINWTKRKFNSDNKLIFINSWNDYQNGNYLEPDKIYGYASINAFSKALFNISFNIKNYIFYNLQNSSLIAIQAHIFYEDLIMDIIIKTNNIPVKFDLFISTVSFFLKLKIETIIKKHSKSNKYEIKLVKNKGRDVLPLINQMKTKIKKYKYLCHIHTKKSNHDLILGNYWRKYLYGNLLGNKQIVSEILYDFETNEKLGFAFPELYFNMIRDIDNFYKVDFIYNKPNIKYMNYLLNKLFPGYKIGNFIIFPVGNMFWAKVNAIYQIFQKDFESLFPKESGQTNGTIMHAIERLWLYLVKLNGYYYKMIFKYF